MNWYLETCTFRKAWGELHLEIVRTQDQTDRDTGYSCGLFFFYLFFLLLFCERRAFSGSENLNFFFFIQFLPHLSPLRASHISRKKIISVHRKLRTVSSTRCIYLLGTFIEHLGVLATPQVLGTQCKQDHPRLQGALPSRKNLEHVTGSGQGSVRSESAICGGVWFPCLSPAFPSRIEDRSVLTRPWGPWGRFITHEAWAGDDGLELDSIGLICPILMKPREVVAGGVDGLATWPPMELQQVSYQRDGGGGSLSGAVHWRAWYLRDKSLLWAGSFDSTQYWNVDHRTAGFHQSPPLPCGTKGGRGPRK